MRHVGTIRFPLWLCPFLGVSRLVCAAQPTTQPGLPALKQQEYLRQMQEKLALPSLRTTDFRKLLRFYLRRGQIVAESSTAGTTWSRAELDNPLFLCTVRRSMQDFFQLTLDDFTDPRNVYFQIEVLASPGQLQIVGSWEFAHNECIVTLIENYGDGDALSHLNLAPTRLMVQEISDNSGENNSFTLTASNWAALAREHPREVRKYIRPILNDLHGASLLQPDPHIQWQLFGPRATPSLAAMTAVRRILPLLDSESFSQRQASLRQLIALGTPGVIALMHIDRQPLSPEQSARVVDVLVPYQQLTAQQAADLMQQPEFLLDCMDSDDPQLRRLATEQLQRFAKRPIAFDPDAKPPMRETEISTLRRSLSLEN